MTFSLVQVVKTHLQPVPPVSLWQSSSINQQQQQQQQQSFFTHTLSSPMQVCYARNFNFYFIYLKYIFLLILFVYKKSDENGSSEASFRSSWWERDSRILFIFRRNRTHWDPTVFPLFIYLFLEEDEGTTKLFQIYTFATIFGCLEKKKKKKCVQYKVEEGKG